MSPDDRRSLRRIRTADGRMLQEMVRGEGNADLYFRPAVRLQGLMTGELLVLLARLGLLRAVMGAQLAELPEPYRSASIAAMSSPRAARAIRAEDAHVTRGLQGLRLDPPRLGEDHGHRVDQSSATQSPGCSRVEVRSSVRSDIPCSHACT